MRAGSAQSLQSTCKLPSPSKLSRCASGSTRDIGPNAGGMACFSNFTHRPLKPQFYVWPALCRGHKTPARATRGGKMKRFPLALLALAVALAITPAALADTFYFNFDSSAVNANGTLVGTEIGNTGVYNITSGSINILNTVFSGPAGSGPLEAAGNSCCAGGPATDNLLYYPSGSPTYGTYVDFDGMDFSVNGEVVSLWAGDNNYPGTSYSLGLRRWHFLSRRQCRFRRPPSPPL